MWLSNGPIQFKSVGKIWPLLELLGKKVTARLLVLAECLQVLACSHSRITQRRIQDFF